MKIDVTKIDALRNKKGWTNAQLAIQTGVSEQTLRNIRKSGKCSDKIGADIALAFGINADDLIPGGEVEPEKEKPDQEIPEAITETLQAIRSYGAKEYQRGKEEMCDIFLRAVREAIERWEENESNT